MKTWLSRSLRSAIAWVLGTLAFCGLVVVGSRLDFESRHHNLLTEERAMQILRDSEDVELRNGAIGRLRDLMAITVVKLQAMELAGDHQAGVALARLRQLWDK